jgi:beta-N-acetylhexosaminidase
MKWKSICKYFSPVLFCLLNSSCNYDKNNSEENNSDSKPLLQKNIIDSAKRNFALPHFYSTDTRLQFLTDSIFNTMSNEEKAAQLIMPAVSDERLYKYPYYTALSLYKRHIIGGILFLKNKKETVSNQIRLLRKLQDSLKYFPLIFACDGEPALFHRKFTNADSLLKASEQNSIQDVIANTSMASEQIKAMGLNWNFAPVADISFNQLVIGNRSFGNNPTDVFNKCCTFIKTSNDFNIATCIKHFPGHGAVEGDTHKGIVTIAGAFKEIAGFKKIIDSVAPVSVMIGHIAVNNFTRFNTNSQPSSLSKNIVTGLLKDSFKYKGIIVSDAMSMGAVKNITDADEKAIDAGVDLVVMPQNPVKLHRYILGLLANRNSKILIYESVKKIIRLKICLGLFAPSK